MWLCYSVAGVVSRRSLPSVPTFKTYNYVNMLSNVTFVTGILCTVKVTKPELVSEPKNAFYIITMIIATASAFHNHASPLRDRTLWHWRGRGTITTVLTTPRENGWPSDPRWEVRASVRESGTLCVRHNTWVTSYIYSCWSLGFCVFSGIRMGFNLAIEDKLAYALTKRR